MSEITAKVGKGDDASAPITVTYDIPENTKDLIAAFTEKVVAAHANSSITIALQGFVRGKIRAALTDGKTPDAAVIQKLVNEWKPGVKVPGKSKAEKIKDDFEKMGPDERAALLKQLQTQQKAA